MNKFFITLSFIFFVVAVNAQFTVRVVVNSIATKQTDNIYIAGNFNNWNPADNNYKLKPFGGGREVFVFNNIAAGNYEFKLTRGSWDKVETTAKGEGVPNHSITVNNDTSVEITIAGWKDAFPDKPIPNTASANVHLMDSSFYIPQLNRYRRIWIYLPHSYNQTKTKNYPVLYMNDGQNLFNDQTASFRNEWGVDECIDTLSKQLHKEYIVVGIDNSDKRMNEYNPYNNDSLGAGEGKQYVAFVATTLKPYIDKHYRTEADAQHTFIAGSSMGGLISMYALVEYPDVFGGAGIFSPSFWIAPQIYTDVANAKWQKNFRIYFYCGEKESLHMVHEMQKMFTVINQKNCCVAKEVTFPLGKHNETYWREEFPDFYRWLPQ